MNRLYRSESNKIIAGVCAGLANYLGIDPTVARILYILGSVFLAGSGILLYIILWAIMPSEY